MSNLDDKTLQQFYDGELDDEQHAEVEAQLADSEEDQQRLASMGQMSQLLQANLGGAADEADLDGLWERVRADLPATKAVEDEAPESAWARFKAWLSDSMGTHPMGWLGAGGVAAAAAVVITLMAIPDPEPTKPPMGEAAAPGDNVDIDEIDGSMRHPKVYQVKDGMRTTTVIWVEDDDHDDDEPDSDSGDDGDDI